MHQQLLRDLDRDLDRHRQDVVDHLMVRYLLLASDKDQTMLVLHLFVVGNFLCQHLQGVAHPDALQILDVLNLVALRPFRDVARLVVVQVGAELHHQLRMDCFQDVVGAALHHQLRMDCFQDVVLPALPMVELELQEFLLQQPLLLPAQLFLHLVTP
jgi:hypothetical protein